MLQSTRVACAIVFLALLSAAGGEARRQAPVKAESEPDTGRTDWPQLAGPDRSGISGETGLAATWPADGPRVCWSVQTLGPGFGGAAVHGGEVFLLDRITGKQDVLRCFDLGNGKELWRYAYDAPGELEFPGARSTPTVDAHRVYILGPFGHLHAIDRATHKPAWSLQLAAEALRPPTHRSENQHVPEFVRQHWRERQHRPKKPRNQPRWGHSQSPILHKDLLIVAVYGRDAGLIAYDRATGKTQWMSEPIGINRFCFANPIIVTLAGREQVITMANLHPYGSPPALLCGVDVDDGRLLWRMRTWKRYNVPVPSPVAIGPRRVFVAGGYRIGCFAFDVTPGEDQWQTDYAFRDNDNATPHLQTPILYRDHLYVQSFDGYHNRSNHGLTCLSLDGQTRWKTGPDELFGNGAMLIADGRIYVMNGENGELSLVAATPQRYRLLARAKVLEAQDGQVWAPMALSRGNLLVRDRHTLRCLDVSHPSEERPTGLPAQPQSDTASDATR